MGGIMNKIYGEMTMEDYHATSALNSTTMRNIANVSCESANHDRNEKPDEEEEKKKKQTATEIARFEGNVVHHIFETKETDSKYQIAPVDSKGNHISKNSNEYKDFVKELPEGVSPLTKVQHKMAHKCLENALIHEESKKFLQHGMFERSYFCELQDVEVKARPDIDMSHIATSNNFPCLVDIKTRGKGRAKRDIWNYEFWTSHTYLQCGLQIMTARKLGLEVDNYFYLLVEKVPPYQVNVVPVDAESIHWSIRATQNLIEQWKAWLDNGCPKSYGLKQKAITTPEWIKTKYV